MRRIQFLFLLIARFCLSLIFILSSFNKIFNWQAVESGLVNLLIQWYSYVHHEALREFFTQMLSFAPLLLILAAVLEFVGGVLILLGIKPRLGAFLLIVFLIPTTILFHQFWFLDGPEKELQMEMFLKNTAILGGLLYVLVFGTRIRPNGIRFPISKNSDSAF